MPVTIPRPYENSSADATKYATKQMFSPRLVHCNVTGTVSYIDMDGTTRTVEMYKGQQYDGVFMFGFPTAAVGDLTLVF